jgi:hypothetical protein
MIYLDSASVLKGISNTSTSNNTLHITQMLKDKTETGIARKKSSFTGSRGSVELKLMRGPTRRQSNQSKKAEIVNYYYQ